MKRTLILIVFASALTRTAATQITDRQTKAENSLIQAVALNFELYRVAHAGALPKNWVMLQESFLPSAWAASEAQFREFGATAGFTNSIYEKFVFVPPGVAAGFSGTGDLLFMSSESFEIENGEWIRFAVCLRGDNPSPLHLSEWKVKEIFAKAKQPIPQPPPMPSAIRADPMKEALKLHEAKFHREHPELFNGSPKQRGLAWEKYAAEGLNQTNPPPAESAPTPLAVSQPPVPPVSGSVSLLWPLLVLALGALGVFFFWRQGARRK